MDRPIDFVVTWVDGNDPAWQADKEKHRPESTPGDARAIRYREWDNLRYWFRAVETYAPWVRKVHLVTWGHVPAWLNTDCDRLHIAKHQDFMPPEYVPSFSSRAIELNMHRIEGLADQFVYFNDDMFLVKPMRPGDFFLNGLPRDVGVLSPYFADVRNSISGPVANNMEIINTTFDRKKTLLGKPSNWFNPKYRAINRFTLASRAYPRWFPGFWGSHFPNNYLKSTFEEIWEKEYQILHKTCLHKFRDPRDVNHWLIRYWQLAANRFIPRDIRGRQYVPLKNNVAPAVNAILDGKNCMICLNDREGIDDFEAVKGAIQRAFEQKLPAKSSFEK